MGLPVWREPTDKTSSKSIHCDSTPPVAGSRVISSRIRRRPSIHGLRSRARLAREQQAILHSRTLDRSPPLSHSDSQSRRNARPGVPPISTLLESADRSIPPLPPSVPASRSPPPPVPESRNYHDFANRDVDERPLRAMRGSGIWTRSHEQVSRSSRATGHVHDDGGAPHSFESSRIPFTRSPEPTETQRERPDTSTLLHNALPTPPLDQSDGDSESLFVASMSPSYLAPLTRSIRRSHPLSLAWRPDSPINGLGDRVRSPTPADEWELMQATIAPDATLPSADSSFASAAASHSFTSSSDGTTITEPEVSSPSQDSRRNTSDLDSQSESVSSLDPDDLCAEDEQLLDEATQDLARDMYFREMETPEGRQRIATHQRIRDEEGNRFALAGEYASVDIGFRLIEAALDDDEGRQRVMALRAGIELEREYGPNLSRLVRFRDHSGRQRRRTHPHDHADQPSSPSSSQSRFPPIPQEGMETSNDAPEAHPVSPPNPRTHREVSDALLSDIEGDEQDLNALRWVVERLASRDDVPDEWWMSMGLNLSRARPRNLTSSRRQAGASVGRAEMELGRVRDGRVERTRDTDRDRVSRL